MIEDAALLDDYAKTGAERSFRTLLERHLPLVYSAALRIVNGERPLAEEIAQTVFTDLARKAPAVAARLSARREALPGWLHTSARFAALSAIRAQRRRKQREAEAASMSDCACVDAQAGSDWERLGPVLDEAMSRLHAADRDALILKFFRGERLKDIGLSFGISEDAARMRINRALEKLRNFLAAQGIAASSSALGALLSTNAVQAAPPNLAGHIATAASAAAGASGFAFSAFMSTKLKLAAAGALLAAGAGMPLIVQQQTIQTLRDENRALAAIVAQPPSVPPPQPAPSGLSRSEYLELLRLRGEVGLLRKESKALALPQTAPASASGNGFSAKVLKAPAWANVGLQKPDDAIQTFLWAGRHGQAGLLENVVRWKVQPGLAVSEALEQSMTNLLSSTIDFAPKISGLSILDQQMEQETTVRMRIAFDLADGKRMESDIQLVKDNDMWHPLFHVWTNPAGDLLATMDMPPAQP